MSEKNALRVDRLKSARLQHQWTQREFGAHCGLADAQISRYENGLVDPSSTHLKAMAETLGVSTDYLLGLTDHPQGKVVVELDALEQQMLGAMAGRDVAAILEIAAQFVRRERGDPDPTATG